MYSLDSEIREEYRSNIVIRPQSALLVYQATTDRISVLAKKHPLRSLEFFKAFDLKIHKKVTNHLSAASFKCNNNYFSTKDRRIGHWLLVLFILQDNTKIIKKKIQANKSLKRKINVQILGGKRDVLIWYQEEKQSLFIFLGTHFSPKLSLGKPLQITTTLNVHHRFYTGSK